MYWYMPNLISGITKLVYELPPELTNDLRLRKLEDITKNLRWRPSTQCTFEKFNFGNSSLKITQK